MEMEQNFLNKKLKTITAYYGELVLDGEEVVDAEPDSQENLQYLDNELVDTKMVDNETSSNIVQTVGVLEVEGKCMKDFAAEDAVHNENDLKVKRKTESNTDDGGNDVNV
jgi:hypothetical protein